MSRANVEHRRVVQAAASSCESSGSHQEMPLVSLVILTCNRLGFLKLALMAAAAQDYTNMEAVIVDDGPAAVDKDVVGAFAIPGKLKMRLVRMPTRRTIGAKRNAALRASSGSVLIHWDDDDLHPPDQVRRLACPIMNNQTDISAVTFTYIASLSKDFVRFYDYRRPGVKDTPFLGSLSYSRRVAVALWHSGELHDSSHGRSTQRPKQASTTRGRRLDSSPEEISPFADVSLSEDLFFVERALSRYK